MPDTFPKILNHPDRDQIISRLTKGESVREISNWLKEKYDENENNQISSALLDQFRRKYLNLHGTILEDLKLKIKEQQCEEVKDGIKDLVKRNPTYNDKLKEFVDDQIDVKKRLHQFLNAAETRFAQLFDITQNNPNNYKPDRVMIEWLKSMLELVKEIRKVDGAPDQIIQHNVAVQAVEDESAIIQQAIINTFSKLEIELASALMDDFQKTVQELREAKSNNLIYSEKSIDKVQTIMAKIIPAEEKDE